jgi:DNA-binding PadR family transcriptional regulator
VAAVAKRRKVSNLLALPVLSLLAQEPSYPYEIAQTLKARGKEMSAKVNWGSLYTVVANLEKNGFIEVVATDREGRQPERTTYRATPAGEAELVDWLRELVAVPEWQPPPFEAALAESARLGPDVLMDLLRERLAALDEGNATLKATLAEAVAQLPRMLLIELEYQLAMQAAEAGWVRGVLAEMTSGAFGDLDMWRRILKTGEMPPELKELDDRARAEQARKERDEGSR